MARTFLARRQRTVDRRPLSDVGVEVCARAPESVERARRLVLDRVGAESPTSCGRPSKITPVAETSSTPYCGVSCANAGTAVVSKTVSIPNRTTDRFAVPIASLFPRSHALTGRP
ncbi:MAG: hypothetical protein M3P37_03835 [Actinomycetota bacterium]|nr:hypothetical protein [Actinomycetota bacterium]